MSTTRIPIGDARLGDRVLLDYPTGLTATVTKVHRPRNGQYLKVTMVDSEGTVYSRRYLDGPDGSPTNCTLDILAQESETRP